MARLSCPGKARKSERLGINEECGRQSLLKPSPRQRSAQKQSSLWKWELPAAGTGEFMWVPGFWEFHVPQSLSIPAGKGTSRISVNSWVFGSSMFLTACPFHQGKENSCAFLDFCKWELLFQSLLIPAGKWASRTSVNSWIFGIESCSSGPVNSSKERRISVNSWFLGIPCSSEPVNSSRERNIQALWQSWDFWRASQGLVGTLK